MENPQRKVCGFYDKVKKRCDITKEWELICDYKHCTLCKTVAEIREDAKKYGGMR